MQIKKFSVFLDNEGPLTKNDHAQEVVAACAVIAGLGQEVGERFYCNLSVLDDIWGDFGKVKELDPAYSSGHTVKLVLPFLKAMGASEADLYGYARETMRLVPNVKVAIQELTGSYNAWMISTSYSWFIQAFCDATGFDFSRAVSTSVKGFDQISASQDEKRWLLEFMRALSSFSPARYDSEGKIHPDSQEVYDFATDFVWNQLFRMPVGELIKQVFPVGQQQKRAALIRICDENGLDRSKVFYVGDSQTDRGCVNYLNGSGLSMMFNGKGPVCYESDLMYIGQDARAIKVVADIFAALEREGTLAYFRNPQAVYGGTLVTVNGRNREEVEGLEKASIAMRKEFRGCAIGELT